VRIDGGEACANAGATEALLKTMAKICMIAYTFYSSDPRVRREAEALAERGDTVDFICLKEERPSSAGNYGRVRLYPLNAGRYQGKNIVSYLFNYASFFLQSFVLVTWLFFRKRYDIIQVHTMPDFLVFAALIPKLMGAKVILDVHDLMPELYMCKFKSGPRHPVIRLITWVERLSIGFANSAIAVHAPHRDALVRHGNAAQKFGIVLNSPDPRIFHKNGYVRKDDKFRLIYHGTVARRHGLEVALRAVNAVKREVPNLEFLIIGHGDDLQRVKELVEGMELGNCVRFEKTMPVERLPEYLQQADIGVVPILYDPFTRYMLPLKLMEYAGMEIPCISSETETIRAYFDDQMVRFIKPGDEQQMADAILELYRNPKQRACLSANGSRFIAQFGWEHQKQKYFELVDALLPTRN
jgi:glycosyltransferase involved in cell wall biosynthesis